MPKNIGVYCCVSHGTEKYAEFFRETCEQNRSNKYSISYKAVLSGDDAHTPDGFEFVDRVSRVDNPAYSHGLALQSCFHAIEEKYTVFADSDVAILYPNWDNESVENINYLYAAFGCQFPKKMLRYRDFPSIFYCMFDSEILKKCNPDWMPKTNKKPKKNVVLEPITDKYWAEALAVPLNSIHQKDTFWSIREPFYRNGYKGKEIPMYYQFDKESIFSKQLNFNIYLKSQKLKVNHKVFKWFMHEFHWKNKIFATHLGGGRDSRRRGFNTKEAKLWFSCIKEYQNNQ